MKASPFYHEITAKLASGVMPDIRLYAGADRWTSALARRALVGPASATLLPPGADPLALRWPACSVVADVTGLAGDVVRALAEALVRDGCTHAVLIDLADMARTVHVKPLPQQVAA